jgi:CHAT domain-containing protein
MCGVFFSNGCSQSEPATLLAYAYSAARPFEYRLPDHGYGPVRRSKGNQSAFNRPNTLIQAENAIGQRLAAHPSDAQMLSLRGRADLLNGDYENAIESLERSRDIASDEPQTLNDLATAYALRGDAERKPENYPLAIDLYLRSLEKQPGDHQALFNLALVYERMSMVDEAIEAWNKQLAAAPGPGWTEEVRRHLTNQLAIKNNKARLDQVTADPAQFVAKFPATANFDSELYQDIFWQKWLPAVLTSRAARDAAAREAREFYVSHHDGSLERALAEANDPRLAPAFRDLAVAIGSNRAGQSDGAQEAGERAVSRFEEVGVDGTNSAGLLRAHIETAYGARKAGLNDACLRETELVIRAAGAAHYYWLSGQAHLEHAPCADGLARAGTVRAELTQTRGALLKVGFNILALRASGFLTGIDRENSNFGPIWDNAASGLALYWRTAALPSRAQEFHYNMQVAAEQLGLTYCAEIFSRATIRFVQQYGNRGMEADDRVYFAGVLAKRGKRSEEIAELDRAESLLNAMPSGGTRDYLLWDTGMMRADALTGSGDSAGAMHLLDQLALSSRAGAVDEHVRFQEARGAALAAAGDWRTAAEAFRSAVSLNTQKLATLHRWLDKLAYTQSAARAYQGLTSIQLMEEKNPAEALATWRQFKSAGTAVAVPAAPDTLYVTYAVLPQGMAVFSEYEGALRVRLIPTPEKEVESTARSFARMCANPSSDFKTLHDEGHRLFEWLIAPELRQIRPLHIAIRTDSWLSMVPFAALTDESENWLSRNHTILTIDGPEGSAPGPNRPVLSSATIVSAPSTVAPGGERLPFLSASDAEAADVAAFFPKATVLSGAGASASAISSLMSKTSVFHFSGHGWSDSGNGALMLPPSVEGEPQFITSKELANQDCSRCSLVVLSACLTAAGEQTGSVNNESLVQALLGAGAASVVAARWDVDSEATRDLMRQFYSAIHAGGDPAVALARASAATASKREWSHPYYWAGFELYAKENGK